jgi:hypothetical protein
VLRGKCVREPAVVQRRDVQLLAELRWKGVRRG